MQTGVIICEDNDNLRESISTMITFSKDLLLLGSFPDAQNIEQIVKDTRPDVILMDIDMPGASGIDAVKTIRRFNHSVQILMLTVFDDNKHVYDAMCAGASGYLLKKYISDKLVDAIRDVLKGEVPMSPGIARIIMQQLQQLPAQSSNQYELTNREKEILTSLAKGNSYKMIAADFGISIDTVRTHIKRIYEKLQVHNQTEAVLKAINEKLV